MNLQIVVLNFLIAIAAVESNGGKQLNHPKIMNLESIQYGDEALSKYGIMPNTIRMYSTDPDAIKMFQDDYNYQFKIAYRHAIRLLQSTQGCIDKASILWLKGIGGQITLADYQTPRYKRFKREFEALNGHMKECL